MRSLIRLRHLSTLSKPLPIPPPTIRELAPQFQFLTSPTLPSTQLSDTRPLFAEVLRCHAYFDEAVFNNVRHFLKAKETGNGAEAKRFHKIRYIAVVYHAMIGNEQKRSEMLKLAEQAERCKVPMLRREQELFLNSMNPSEEIPDFRKCLHKNDLIFCYFRRELSLGRWPNLENLVLNHPKEVEFYANIDLVLDVAKRNRRHPPELVRLLMRYSMNKNPYFVNLADFATVFKKILRSESAEISSCKFDKRSGLVSDNGKTLKTKKTYISKENLELLKQRIDVYVKGSKEGLVRSKEFQKVSERVAEWKKERNLTDGRDVVVVDALNFGTGADPKDWSDISRQFKHVVFATKMPPVNVRERVIKRYKGNVVFCDSQSADDLIILRMALEFGRETSLVTNDRYRDHRLGICERDVALEKIWDDFMTDAVYRHDKETIEPRRDFNLRIVSPTESTWFVPVLNEDSEMLRNPTVYCITSSCNDEPKK